MNLGTVTDEAPAESAKHADDAAKQRQISTAIQSSVKAAEVMARGTGRTHAVLVAAGVVRIVDMERTELTEFVNVVGVAPGKQPGLGPWFWMMTALAGLLLAILVWR